MRRVTKYILKNFVESFNPIFFSLFFMVSIIYFIKIAKITSVIKITFLELAELYLYILPRIIIYTFPVVFFISVAMSLVKLSKDNEITVMFAFGYSPKQVAKIFGTISLIVTAFLLMNAIFLVPISKQLYSNFVDIKRAEAKLNINAMEFGQKFSNWLVFINKSDKQNNFKDIVMYSKEKDKENFILANNANISNKNGALKLTLNNGKVFTIYSDSIKQTNYKKLLITRYQNMEISSSKGVLSYWKKALEDNGRAKDFAIFVLVSLFPISTFLLSISFGIFNSRYENNNVYAYIFITVLSYYVVMYYLISVSPLAALIAIPISAIAISYVIFKRKILKRY